jgi:hypothetical protein
MEWIRPSFPQISQDLETLKLALIDTTHDEIDPVDAAAVAQEISAIRLQLKRLEGDRVLAMKRFDGARGIESHESQAYRKNRLLTSRPTAT